MHTNVRSHTSLQTMCFGGTAEYVARAFPTTQHKRGIEVHAGNQTGLGDLGA